MFGARTALSALFSFGSGTERRAEKSTTQGGTMLDGETAGKNAEC
jgi:hypothetical protein